MIYFKEERFPVETSERLFPPDYLSELTSQISGISDSANGFRIVGRHEISRLLEKYIIERRERGISQNYKVYWGSYTFPV